MTEQLFAFVISKPSSDYRWSLFRFQGNCHRDIKGGLFWEFARWCLLCFKQFYYAVIEKLHKHFSGSIDENEFCICDKWSEQWTKMKTLCVHVANFLNVSINPFYFFHFWYVESAVQFCNLRSVCSDKPVQSRRRGRNVMSWNQKKSSNTRAICALNDLICMTTRNDWRRTLCVLWSSTCFPSSLCWTKGF